MEQIGVTVPLQSSVAVALPQPGIVPGLHPRFEPGGQNVNTGLAGCEVQINVCVQVDELPQKSVAV